MKRITKDEYVSQMEALGLSRETKTILDDRILTEMEEEGLQFFFEGGVPQILTRSMLLERALRL